MPQNPVYAFTTHYTYLSKVLANKVIVSQAFDLTNKEDLPPHKEFIALWDTGATNTVITKKVIDDCELKPLGIVKTHTANGIMDSHAYLISIGLPNKIGIYTKSY